MQTSIFKNKALLHIFLSLAAIGLKANGGADKEQKGTSMALKEQFTDYAASLNCELGEFLSSGYFGDVFFASEITKPTEGDIAENIKPAGKKFALKIVKNKIDKSTVCENYQRLKELFPSGSEQLLLPLKIGVMPLVHSETEDKNLKEIDSFCFLVMDLGLQSFDEPIFKTIGLDESNKRLNQDIILGFFGQMLLGMEELLRKGIRHNDFRGANILLFSQFHLTTDSKVVNEYQAKLIDFDLIDFETLPGFDKNDQSVEIYLTTLSNEVIWNFTKIININKAFLLDDGKMFPDPNKKEIVKRDFPLFSEFFDSVKVKLSKALEDFYKSIDKKILI